MAIKRTETTETTESTGPESVKIGEVYKDSGESTDTVRVRVTVRVVVTVTNDAGEDESDNEKLKKLRELLKELDD